MNWRAVRTQFAIILSLATAACGGGGGGGGGSNPQSQTISFAQAGPLSLPIGATVTNVASGGGGTGAITYQSSNTSALTVNATSGLATGIAVGSATVTATKAADANFTQAQATYTVNVQLQQQTIAFELPGTLTLILNTTLSNVASGGGGSGAITYQSTNSSILTVDVTTGVATGVLTGTAAVTATKAADAGFAQTQATYTVHVQTTSPMGAWIGATDTEVALPTLAIGKQFVRAPAATCATPADVGSCPNAESSAVATIDVTDTAATLTRPAYYQLTAAAAAGAPSLVAANRFSERIGHAALFFHNRYWVIGGGQPQFPTAVLPLDHTTLADVWSSADGKSWKLETDAAAFGPRWFHQAVVYQGAMWVISGAATSANTLTNFLSDAWRSTDGVNWTQVASNIGLPWYSVSLNVAVFKGSMWAVSGGSAFESTDGITWTRRSTTGAIAGVDGRAYASLTVYDGSLWFIGGSRFIASPPFPPNAFNDVWKSSNGIDWVQVTANAGFSKRSRHASFVIDGRLWVFGGQTADGSGPAQWARDSWSTTDGVQWGSALGDGLNATYLAKVIEQTAPDRVTLIGGIQRGYSNGVWQTLDGRNWSELTVHSQFSPRSTRGVSFDGEMWVVGGGTVNARDGGDAKSNEVWRSINGLDWRLVVPGGTGTVFPPRDGHCVVVFQNKLWVIGGWDGDLGGGGSETRLNDVWSSGDGQVWTKHDPASGVIFAPRVGHEVVVFDDKLWVIAGNLTNDVDVGDVWSSPDGVTWTEVSANVPGLARNSHRVVAFAGEMWLTGGGADSGTSDVFTSPNGTTWTQHGASTLFPSRMRHASGVFNGRLYVMGGLDNEVYGVGAVLGDVWSTADGTSWRQETAAGFAPRWNSAFIIHGGEMWLAGGFNLSYLSDVWRSSDGKNWRLGVEHDIALP